MNKEEAKQKLWGLAFPKLDTIPEKLNLGDVLSIVEQIDEPQAEEPLGVLLVDMPERSWYEYRFLYKDENELYDTIGVNKTEGILATKGAVKVTEAEAKEKYPNFKWVSLEDLVNE